MKIFKSENRYLTDIGWLKSYHSFSFAEHYYPQNKGWGNLRVINEDYIAPGGHFAMHPHRDMEIVSYIAKGKLHHKDSQGNEYTINEGEVQCISAGHGILHSETNPSTSQETILMQLWIKPKVKQTEPSYQQIKLNKEDRKNSLQLIASENGKKGSINIKQDAEIFAGIFDEGISLKYNIKRSKAWLQLIDGQVEIDGYILNKGDALAIDRNVDKQIVDLSINAKSISHFLLFDID